MNTLARNPKVDQALSTSPRWWQETDALRDILLECGLTEELKWRQLCYTHNGRNICIIQGMKDFVALLFFMLTHSAQTAFSKGNGPVRM